jgi:hypothetical protein
MNKLLIGLAAVPLMSSVAFAAQTLSDRQMDTVTAGQFPFFASASGAAESYGGATTASTANLAEVSALRNNSGALVLTSYNGGTLNIIKSVSASESASTATSIPSLEAVSVVSPTP